MTPLWIRRLTAAVSAASAVAAASLAAGAIAWLPASQFEFTVTANALSLYWTAALYGAVVLLLAGLFGAYRRRWVAAVAGVVAAAIAFVLAVVQQAGSLSGFQFTVEYLGYYFFVLAGLIVATPTLGILVHRWVLGLFRGQGGRVVLVRAPSSVLGEGIVTNIARTEVDIEKADEQWDAYVAAFTIAGWQTVEVESADRLPDGVFVEDAAVVISPGIALITRPGAPERRAETASVADRLRSLGLTLYDVEEPATLDGGDVLRVGDVFYVGRSSRTNAAGVRELRELVDDLGAGTVVAVPVAGALHLKSVATALPDGTVLVAPGTIDPTFFAGALVVPEAAGANLVILDESTVLLPASAPGTKALVEDLGYAVVTVDLSEFEKVEGSTTCLSIRLG
ncbi:arginine deiminase family protein [Gryllotalpicola sp.]|uniref:dimethylarginine dimethylaminohydrolase family protein n=1 Tax=Gryllotalpicola sp. TaxID=1932787 RepID=UPI00261EE67A|nr:arginine deiminase family protein [Gryllotalpicola sp.]